ncbi:hypothetical protein EVA_14796 [gut metagenome]|uniref:Uncharacterized protein n=1 Tax=gut metagenome TaxID=749906 RepID=J9FRJ0_9ZZZZ
MPDDICLNIERSKALLVLESESILPYVPSYSPASNPVMASFAVLSAWGRDRYSSGDKILVVFTALRMNDSSSPDESLLVE